MVFLPPALEEESLPGDLFSVLFKCEGHDSPWRALLAHAVALQRPLLAILAACYEVSGWGGGGVQVLCGLSSLSLCAPLSLSQIFGRERERERERATAEFRYYN